jgi:hypothetical protein
LLLTFRYSEHDLMDVAKNVIDASMKCVEDFASICAGDPMINFEVPDAIGFGVSRGTACCLFSGSEVIDYSGHLLNLASRLNDLARPGGIVLDGSFLASVIPESAREAFGEQQVYVRGIAEDRPITVFYQKDRVTVPESALSPLREEVWLSKKVEYTVRKIHKLSKFYLVNLDRPPKAVDRVRVAMAFPKRGIKGVSVLPDITDFEVKQSGPNSTVVLNMETIQKKLLASNATQNSIVTITVQYIPKPLPRT